MTGGPILFHSKHSSMSNVYLTYKSTVDWEYRFLSPLPLRPRLYPPSSSRQLHPRNDASREMQPKGGLGNFNTACVFSLRCVVTHIFKLWVSLFVKKRVLVKVVNLRNVQGIFMWEYWEYNLSMYLWNPYEYLFLAETKRS